MPHFFLHLWDHDHLVEDDEGDELSGLPEARAKAIKAAREIMSRRVAKGQDPDGSAIIIEDDHNRIAMKVTFEESIDRAET